MVESNYNYWFKYGIYFQASYNSWQNTILFNNMYYPVGARCYPCPIGKYNTLTGKKFCTDCPAGHSCPNKAASPVVCPRGSYSNNNTATQAYNTYSYTNTGAWTSDNTNNLYGDTCLPCPKGTYTPTSASTSCLPCPDNMLCPNPAYSPIPIPPGTFTFIIC